MRNRKKRSVISIKESKDQTSAEIFDRLECWLLTTTLCLFAKLIKTFNKSFVTPFCFS